MEEDVFFGMNEVVALVLLAVFFFLGWAVGAHEERKSQIRERRRKGGR